MIVFNRDENSKYETDSYLRQIIIIIISGILVFWLLGFIFQKDVLKHKTLQNEFIANDDVVSYIMTDSSQFLKDENPDSVSFTFFDINEARKPSESFGFNIVEIDSQGTKRVNELGRFFENLYKLETSKTGNVRIAYYGDSMLEDDFIVNTVRSLLQNKYGGSGAGMFPISLSNPSGRHTIKHNFSSNWQTSSLIKRTFFPIGVSGMTSFALNSDSLWISYKPTTKRTRNPVLVYGKSNNMNGKLHISSQNYQQNTSLNPQNTINFTEINIIEDSIMLIFSNVDSIPFFGMDFSAQNGVYVDNFSIRGSSGLPLVHLNKSLMNTFQKYFNYDLIILQFGANVIKPDIKKYKWYCDKMINVVKHIRECFPEADILVISAADKAAKYAAEIKTDTLIYPLLRSQREYASVTNSSFINLFQIMGGEGTMAQWVNREPPLGAKDFIHFSPSGAKILGNAIYEKLEEEYQSYKNIKAGGENNEKN